ncbi:MAG: hypothetical protein WC975_11585 [Phycisphaerae bacterium]
MNEIVQMAGANREYMGQTTINPFGLIVLVILGLSVITLQRRYAIISFLIMACFISSAQRIVIFSIDFNFLRILVIFGLFRVLLKNEWKCLVFKKIDLAIILWACSATLVYTIQNGTFSALVNRLGFSFDALGMYFLFRCLIKNYDDFRDLAKGVIVLSIPVAVAFLFEHFTRRNLFSIFGGVPSITIVREGRLRCQGPFTVCILAGCFWASLMPLIATCWWNNLKEKKWAFIGLFNSMIIVICCSSSTPVMAVNFGVIGGCLFYFRYQMRIIRWGLVLTMITLHIIMQAPVWHLIARVTAVSGSTGWHRYHLINEAINNFKEWFLLGTINTSHWGWGLQDVTNQYILEGIRGGLITLILFIYVIVLAFQRIGQLWKNASNKQTLIMSWALGISLFIHCMNFIGVSYFGQIIVVWYLTLAIVGSLSPLNQSAVPVKAYEKYYLNKKIIQAHSTYS